MSTSGASFLLELSSATATKTGASREERYQLQLNPGIDIPYLAKPKAQLEALTFANVFTNIDQDFYKNAKLKVTWNPYVYTAAGPSVTQPVRYQKSLEVTLPPGHYNVLGGTLQHKIGELLYADQSISETTVPALKHEGTTYTAKACPKITTTSTLFSDMQVLSRLPSKDPVTKLIVPKLTAQPNNTARAMDVANEAVDLVPYIGGWVRLNHDADLSGLTGPIFAQIVGIEPILENIASVANHSSNFALGKSRIHFASTIRGIIDYSDPEKTNPDGNPTELATEELQFFIVPPSIRFKPTGHSSGACPTETADPEFFGYDAVGACPPSFSETSPWALAMTVDQMRSIAMADQNADASPHEALMGTAQNTQYVLPIAMQPDVRTGLLESATGAPILKIDPSSTLFTDALGYTTNDMAEQNPFTHIVTSSSEDVTGEPATNRAMDASKSGRLLRTTSVAFHCPSLVSSSYNQHGELAGAVMASVPITVPSNSVQSWQAMYDTSIPCNLHGGSVDTIDFYLTNQDGDNIDLMGNDWLATVRLSWDQPSVPPLGSFGAEAESAYGLRDVIYATQQQNQR